MVASSKDIVDETISSLLKKLVADINKLPEYDTEVVNGLMDTTIRKWEVLDIIKMFAAKEGIDIQ